MVGAPVIWMFPLMVFAFQVSLRLFGRGRPMFDWARASPAPQVRQETSASSYIRNAVPVPGVSSHSLDHGRPLRQRGGLKPVDADSPLNARSASGNQWSVPVA